MEIFTGHWFPFFDQRINNPVSSVCSQIFSNVGNRPPEMMAPNRLSAAIAAALAVFCLLQAADGYESGAPELTCRTMVPGHGEAAQTSAPTYRIVTSENVTTSRTRVTLTAPRANDFFIGFLIEARVPGSSEDAVGSFVQVPEDSLTLDCNQVPVSVTMQRESAQQNDHLDPERQYRVRRCVELEPEGFRDQQQHTTSIH